MWYNKHTTFQWIAVWVMITIITAWWSKQTQESWTFYIVVASFIVLIGGLFWHWGQGLLKKAKLRQIEVRFLIPRNKYPYKTIQGALPEEQIVRRLSVGIGTYRLLLIAKSKVDVSFDPVVLTFEGSDENKPKILGKDNPFIVEFLTDGQYRDWWGNVNLPAQQYPRYLYHDQTLIDGNRIETTGEWKGQLHVQMPVRDTIIHKHLEFSVGIDNKSDNIPFMRITSNDLNSYDSVGNPASSANTIQVGKAKW